MSASDRLYAANVLSHLSRLTVRIGHGAVIDHDQLHHARVRPSCASSSHLRDLDERITDLLARGNAPRHEDTTI